MLFHLTFDPLASVGTRRTRSECMHASSGPHIRPGESVVQIFPQRLGTPFPRNFVDHVRTICKRLYRVYVSLAPQNR